MSTRPECPNCLRSKGVASDVDEHAAWVRGERADPPEFKLGLSCWDEVELPGGTSPGERDLNARDCREIRERLLSDVTPAQVRDLRAERDAANARADAAEAACAAMREALELCSPDPECLSPAEFDYRNALRLAAVATDAGRAMLDRLHVAEVERDALQMEVETYRALADERGGAR